MRSLPAGLAVVLLLNCASWAGGQVVSNGATQQAVDSTQPLPAASAAAGPASEVPRVPGISGLLHGLNAGVSLSAVHDAGSGYATLLQPAVGYSFNQTYSVDATIPIYLYRLAPSRKRNPEAGQLLVDQELEAGDLLLALHAQFQPHGFHYQATLSASAPTGDAAYGLTSGRPAFDFTSRFDRSYRRITPTIELGAGDSSTVVNSLLSRNYTSLGPLAHFQAGVELALKRGASFETNAYEQLPLGDQKIYDTLRTGRRGVTQTVIAGRNAAEDNGFTNVLDMPMSGHVTLSAYYNRSLRFRNDVVSFGMTYVLRSARSERKSSDDELLRRIEDELAATPGPQAKITAYP